MALSYSAVILTKEQGLQFMAHRLNDIHIMPPYTSMNSLIIVK